MSCSCITKLSNDKFLHEELKKAICLLNNYIYTLTVNQKLMIKCRNEIYIPKCLLRIIRKLICPCFTCNSECCHKDCDKNPCENECKKICENEFHQCNGCVICKECAFYSDPATLETTQLTVKDIIPRINCCNDEEFLRSTTQLIYKYEGFIHFFTKVSEKLEDIYASKKRRT